MLTRFDHRPYSGEAEIRYDTPEFRVIRAGSYVRCAVTGVAIPLDELRYWSVERQEAYADGPTAMQRLRAEHRPQAG
ncbi:hypothetical protein A33M_1143 [Rhodovulum sp. PH10]|uniref:DUF2093 domain-containing protein n=1 Tax=Rhodovulum sp. PH10 TaxID=1187851 RepID=UPI00027C20E0|nr:DUF2093 domain-containing protein [Rhodovulum sp. PH10]EJW09606.1 hypothetical protein A33M_1143 [Rhodovulum sp. PH10]